MPHDPSQALADVLRPAIAGCGQSFSGLALKAGVDDRAIARFVAGEKDLNLSTASKLCSALGLELRQPIRPKGRPRKER